METMITRLFEAVIKRGEEAGDTITDAMLARAIGVRQAAVKYWHDNPGTSLKSEHVFALADFLRIDARWLVTGEKRGLALVVNPEEKVTDYAFSSEITTLISNLRNLHTEISELLTKYQGSPYVPTDRKDSDDMNISSARANTAAAMDLLREDRNEGQHGKHRKNSPKGGKTG